MLQVAAPRVQAKKLVPEPLGTVGRNLNKGNGAKITSLYRIRHVDGNKKPPTPGAVNTAQVVPKKRRKPP